MSSPPVTCGHTQHCRLRPSGVGRHDPPLVGPRRSLWGFTEPKAHTHANRKNTMISGVFERSTENKTLKSFWPSQ